ncbi:MAG: hypothetical protein HN757_07080 [Calditrichaeota bacterium]|jgi:hypothetical protein|nr:hypothetical protein [Calditrichota bacterium]
MTYQLHENIIYDGKDLSMTTCPKVPLDHPRVIELTDEELFASGRPRVISSNCWRGYLGSWEIKNGRLYLIKLDRNLKLKGDEPLFADWVSEELNIVVDYAFEGLRSGTGPGNKSKRVSIKNGLLIGS